MKKTEKKVVKKVVKPIVKKVKPVVAEVVKPVVKPIELKVDVLKSESYCNIKILSISKREDGAYNVSLANGTTTILVEKQYAQDVK